MQERQISNERKIADMQAGLYADKQDELTENKQDNSMANTHTVNHRNKNEDTTSINIPDLGLSSALGYLTPDVSYRGRTSSCEKKKKSKRGFRQE